MKKLLAPTVALLSYLVLASSAYAQGLIGCPKPPFDILCFNETSVPGIIGAAITFIFVIGVITALFFLLTGGVLRLLLGGGDKISAESARNNIIAAIVGLIILFLVFLIFTVLLRFFGLSLNQITNIPHIPST